MDWDRLKTFYHVATAGSISRAMDTIHLSQSAITRQIQSLEHSLKTKLFKRHTKGITLTEQGSYLFEETEKIFADLNSIEKKIVDISQFPLVTSPLILQLLLDRCGLAQESMNLFMNTLKLILN